jgi:hypothetical protein
LQQSFGSFRKIFRNVVCAPGIRERRPTPPKSYALVKQGTCRALPAASALRGTFSRPIN